MAAKQDNFTNLFGDINLFGNAPLPELPKEDPFAINDSELRLSPTAQNSIESFNSLIKQGVSTGQSSYQDAARLAEAKANIPHIQLMRPTNDLEQANSQIEKDTAQVSATTQDILDKQWADYQAALKKQQEFQAKSTLTDANGIKPDNPLSESVAKILANQQFMNAGSAQKADLVNGNIIPSWKNQLKAAGYTDEQINAFVGDAGLALNNAIAADTKKKENDHWDPTDIISAVKKTYYNFRARNANADVADLQGALDALKNGKTLTVDQQNAVSSAVAGNEKASAAWTARLTGQQSALDPSVTNAINTNIVQRSKDSKTYADKSNAVTQEYSQSLQEDLKNQAYQQDKWDKAHPNAGFWERAGFAAANAPIAAMVTDSSPYLLGSAAMAWATRGKSLPTTMGGQALVGALGTSADTTNSAYQAVQDMSKEQLQQAKNTPQFQQYLAQAGGDEKTALQIMAATAGGNAVKTGNALGAATALIGPEMLVARALSGNVGRAASRVLIPETAGAVRQGLTKAGILAGEVGLSAAGEGIEEGGTQYLGNRAAIQTGVNIDPMAGVAESAGVGALLGGVMGTGGTVLSGTVSYINEVNALRQANLTGDPSVVTQSSGKFENSLAQLQEYTQQLNQGQVEVQALRLGIADSLRDLTPAERQTAYDTVIEPNIINNNVLTEGERDSIRTWLHTDTEVGTQVNTNPYILAGTTDSQTAWEQHKAGQPITVPMDALTQDVIAAQTGAPVSGQFTDQTIALATRILDAVTTDPQSTVHDRTLQYGAEMDKIREESIASQVPLDVEEVQALNTFAMTALNATNVRMTDAQYATYQQAQQASGQTSPTTGASPAGVQTPINAGTATGGPTTTTATQSSGANPTQQGNTPAANPDPTAQPSTGAGTDTQGTTAPSNIGTPQNNTPTPAISGTTPPSTGVDGQTPENAGPAIVSGPDATGQTASNGGTGVATPERGTNGTSSATSTQVAPTPAPNTSMEGILGVEFTQEQMANGLTKDEFLEKANAAITTETPFTKKILNFVSSLNSERFDAFHVATFIYLVNAISVNNPTLDFVGNAGGKKNVAGFFRPATNTVHILRTLAKNYPADFVLGVINHELGHAVTAHNIEKDEFANEKAILTKIGLQLRDYVEQNKDNLSSFDRQSLLYPINSGENIAHEVIGKYMNSKKVREVIDTFIDFSKIPEAAAYIAQEQQGFIGVMKRIVGRLLGLNSSNSSTFSLVLDKVINANADNLINTAGENVGSDAAPTNAVPTSNLDALYKGLIDAIAPQLRNDFFTGDPDLVNAAIAIAQKRGLLPKKLVSKNKVRSDDATMDAVAGMLLSDQDNANLTAELQSLGLDETTIEAYTQALSLANQAVATQTNIAAANLRNYMTDGRSNIDANATNRVESVKVSPMSERVKQARAKTVVAQGLQGKLASALGFDIAYTAPNGVEYVGVLRSRRKTNAKGYEFYIETPNGDNITLPFKGNADLRKNGITVLSEVYGEIENIIANMPPEQLASISQYAVSGKSIPQNINEVEVATDMVITLLPTINQPNVPNVPQVILSLVRQIWAAVKQKVFGTAPAAVAQTDNPQIAIEGQQTVRIPFENPNPKKLAAKQTQQTDATVLAPAPKLQTKKAGKYGNTPLNQSEGVEGTLNGNRGIIVKRGNNFFFAGYNANADIHIGDINTERTLAEMGITNTADRVRAPNAVHNKIGSQTQVDTAAEITQQAKQRANAKAAVGMAIDELTDQEQMTLNPVVAAVRAWGDVDTSQADAVTDLLIARNTPDMADSVASDVIKSYGRNAPVMAVLDKIWEKVKSSLGGFIVTVSIALAAINGVVNPTDANAQVVVTNPIATMTNDANAANAYIQQNNDAAGKPYIIADKKGGMIYVMDSAGNMVDSAPALFGKDVGDGQSLTTTPAGKFTLTYLNNPNHPEYGGSFQEFARYNDGKVRSVSIHRVLENGEHRTQRLASKTAKDNRISHGCINVPAAFYNKNLDKTFDGPIYVLPETNSYAGNRFGTQPTVVKSADQVVQGQKQALDGAFRIPSTVPIVLEGTTPSTQTALTAPIANGAQVHTKIAVPEGVHTPAEQRADGTFDTLPIDVHNQVPTTQTASATQAAPKKLASKAVAPVPASTKADIATKTDAAVGQALANNEATPELTTSTTDSPAGVVIEILTALGLAGGVRRVAKGKKLSSKNNADTNPPPEPTGSPIPQGDMSAGTNAVINHNLQQQASNREGWIRYLMETGQAPKELDATLDIIAGTLFGIVSDSSRTFRRGQTASSRTATPTTTPTSGLIDSSNLKDLRGIDLPVIGGVLAWWLRVSNGQTPRFLQLLAKNNASRIGAEGDAYAMAAAHHSIGTKSFSIFGEFNRIYLKPINDMFKRIAKATGYDLETVSKDMGFALTLRHLRDEGFAAQIASFDYAISQAEERIQALRDDLSTNPDMPANTKKAKLRWIEKYENDIKKYEKQRDATADAIYGRTPWSGQSNEPGIVGGRTLATVNAELAAIEAKYPMDVIDAAVKLQADSIMGMRSYATAYGIFTQDDIDRFNAIGYKQYVPLFLADEDVLNNDDSKPEQNVEASAFEDWLAPIPLRQQRSLGLTRDISSYTRKGSHTPSADGFTNLQKVANNWARRAAQAEFLLEIEKHYEGTHNGIENVDTTDQAWLDQINSENGSLFPGLVRYRSPLQAPRSVKDNTQAIVARGHDRQGNRVTYYYYFTDDAVRNELIKGMSTNIHSDTLRIGNLNVPVGSFRTITRTMARLMTMVRPTWVLTNATLREPKERASVMLARDVVDGNGNKVNNAKLVATYTALLASLDTPANLAEIYDYINTRKVKTPLQRLLHEAYMAGAITIRTDIVDVNQTGTMFGREKNLIEKTGQKIADTTRKLRAKSKTANAAAQAAETIISPIEKGAEAYVTGFVETPQVLAALAAVQAYIEHGVTKQEAFNRVRDQFDTARGTEWQTALGALFPFVRAIMAGNYNTAYSLTQGGYKGWGALVGTAMLNMAVIMALGWAFGVGGGDDEDGIPWVAKLPTAAFKRGLPIVREDEEGKRFVTYIPTAQGVPQLGTVIGAALMKWAYGTNTVTGVMQDISLALMDHISPVSMADPKVLRDKGPAAYLGLSLTPSLLQPFSQMAFNTTSFGANTIYKVQTRQGERDSNVDDFNTPQTYKDAAKFLYENTGGMVDMRPETIKLFTSTWLGYGPLKAISGSFNDKAAKTFDTRTSTVDEIGPFMTMLGASSYFDYNSLSDTALSYAVTNAGWERLKHYGIKRSDPDQKGPAYEKIRNNLIKAGATPEDIVFITNTAKYDTERTKLEKEFKAAVEDGNSTAVHDINNQIKALSLAYIRNNSHYADNY